MDSACNYCGSDIDRHTPVFTEELRQGDREQTGQFCNYACLTAYIDEQELMYGASCEIDL